MLNYLCAILLGACLTLAFAPFNAWYVTPAVLIGFLHLLSRSARPGLLGWVFGFSWFLVGTGWVYVSIADHGGFPLIVAMLLTALLAAYLAIFPSLFTYLLTRFVQPSHWLFVSPILWLCCEWLRGTLFTGFPWLSLGYSQQAGPLSAFYPYVGEIGVSGMLIVMACVIQKWLYQSKITTVLIGCATLLMSTHLLNYFDEPSPSVDKPVISLVQGNIAQSVRWQPENEVPTMEKYWQLSEAVWEKSDVIIWPEAAIPRIEPLAQEYLHQLDQKGLETQTGVLTGILNYNLESREAFNAVIGLGMVSTSTQDNGYYYPHKNRYYKHHLLPIGEFVPLEKWLRKLGGVFDLAWSSFTRGDYLQPDLSAGGYQFTAALCYEILFADQVRDNLKADTDFIVTLSNDAWFGRSHGPYQHLQIAQVRAHELGLPVLRATNNGVTAIIDRQGNIVQQAPQFSAGTISAAVEVNHSKTIFRQWGSTPTWILSLLLLVGVLFAKRRAKTNPQETV